MKITDKHGQQWQLVPLDPTESIERAYCWQQEKSGFLNCYPVYKAMLSAAPEPKLPEGLEPVAWMSTGGDVSRSKKYFNEMGFESEPLVLQSAALAMLAEKDAEIERLNREASACDMLEEYRQDAQTTADALGSIQRQFEMVSQDRDDWIACHAKIFRERNELREQVQRQAALIEQCREALVMENPLAWKELLTAIEKELSHD